MYGVRDQERIERHCEVRIICKEVYEASVHFDEDVSQEYLKCFGAK